MWGCVVVESFYLIFLLICGCVWGVFMQKELQEALNKQLNRELRNAYLYLAMSAFFEEKGLSGFAHYFRLQSKEELGHAMRIYKFLSDRGWRIELYDIPAPSTNWEKPINAIREFLESERSNTKRIWELVDIARRAGDKATEQFLQWFIEEQVEEEKSALDLYTKLEMIGDNISALLMFDQLLAQRKS